MLIVIFRDLGVSTVWTMFLLFQFRFRERYAPPANVVIQKFINVNKITEYTGNEVFDWVVEL